MLGEHNIDVINATSFISDDFHKLLNNYFKNCNTIFEDKNAIYFDTWTAQLNYYLKIIDSIKQNQLKNIFYDLFIFTRLDLQFHKSFLEHNIKCLDEMTTDQIIWMRTLREMIKSKKIKLVDEESCVEFTAYGFYFDYKKNLCIINPR
jgi:hypothetical protein